MNKSKNYVLLFCLIFLNSFTVGVNADNFPIAGLNPSERPAGAPKMEWSRNNYNWYKKALTGISQPYPKSLYFLDNQGNWYTPFNRPGMTGRYDIRNWHR
jgi:hypothetical protein